MCTLLSTLLSKILSMRYLTLCLFFVSLRSKMLLKRFLRAGERSADWRDYAMTTSLIIFDVVVSSINSSVKELLAGVVQVSNIFQALKYLNLFWKEFLVQEKAGLLINSLGLKYSITFISITHMAHIDIPILSVCRMFVCLSHEPSLMALAPTSLL